ncbi:NADH-quinone oxidoreductase subunit NuoG [Candidatus Palibaumannia cicadellinicola]|uniref:NADH-quinone oxidoreductase n=1 Tax=Baumannia cicadellinicola subsp. Homalodisca coagulata TaxID=374463 RepID=Q1LT94_BAUCH|nr:NADH-quinone oxidoreductase subunit NuoG [Candidatus Baumannia cicadellinicola]ABF14091.1 NADH-quinone oxidoreductase, chain G [Baumannia cicadellinicola str. Hc (Homalodisca coagulata)]MCJ7462717.1 NADH-quinone oxidoreductase subunit NuoG [Candidatus Baumannia cicadellinicola]
MVTISIDGKKYDVHESKNLLEACLSLGLDVPYFCWHPALGSAGACRLCAIKQYQNIEDIEGKLVMSCMTPVLAGTVISINENEAKQFRQRIIELLMINHPHDCPVCEEGGNCHLQDMTVMTGHCVRRYRFTKRTHNNQYLGPFISHEMNRCITCYRCVRFYKDYANGTDFGVYGTHDNVYFGRLQSGVLESEFAGNLVEICPTGVFTDKTHSKRYNRKWDMQFAPSICQQCSIGCNISPGERYGELRRIDNRYNGNVNHYFLCDIGRFGYGYVNLKNRPRQPLLRRGNDWITLNTEQALISAANLLREANKIIGIGSARASIESNFALRELVGKNNFYIGISDNEQNQLLLMLKVLRNSGIYTPSLREIESYDAVLVLGEDITQTGARIALAVRQAVKNPARAMAASKKIFDWQVAAIKNVGQQAKSLLFITNVDSTKLDDIATWSYHAPVDDQARLGFAIAHALDKNAPAVNNLDPALQSKITLIVEALLEANKPLIISGSHAGSEAIIAAAANIARALKNRGNKVGISFIASSVNSMGMAIMGGGNLNHALIEIEQGTVDSVIVLENDLYRHALAPRIDQALTKVKNLIVIDHQRTALLNKANLIFSAASFVESNGTVINQEGRAQRFFQVYDPAYYNPKALLLASWRWLHLIHITYLSRSEKWTKLDHIINHIVKTIPQLAKIKDIAPDANFRIHGQKLAREPHRYSGRTAMITHLNVHEPQIAQDHETMFTFSMEGNNDPFAPRQQIAFSWAPGWNSPQSWNKFQDEIGGHLRYGDPGVRLLEMSDDQLDWFKIIPPAFIPKLNETWRIAPYWHLFGSDETSQLSPIIQQYMPTPYVVINRIDAIRLGLNHRSQLTFSYGSQEWCLPIRFSDNLNSGQLGLPLGFPGIPPILAGLSVQNLREINV